MTKNSPIYSLAVLQNDWLASSAGLFENTIKIWNASNRGLIKTITGQNGYVYSLAVFKNGHLASAGADNVIKIWNVIDSSIVRTLTGHRLGVFISSINQRLIG